MQFPERYESAVASEYFQASAPRPKKWLRLVVFQNGTNMRKFAGSLFEDRIRSWDELEIPNLDLLVRCLENISNISQQMVVSEVDFHPMVQSVKITNQTNQSQESLRIRKNPKNHSQGSLGIPKQIQANKQIQAKKGGGKVIPVSLSMLATPPSQRVGLGLDRSPRT